MTIKDVTYVSQAPHDAVYIITLVDGEFVLSANGQVVARSPNPRRLSDFAFANHAKAIRHDYDLRHAP